MSDPALIAAQQFAQQGAALAGRGNLPGALQAFQQAAAAWPAFAEAHASVGSLLSTMGRHSEAIGPLQTALRLNPRFTAWQFLLGHALLMLGRIDQAEPPLRAALAQEPNHVEALHDLGIVQFQRGQFAESLTTLSRAVALRPQFAEAWANRGAALESLGRAAEALASYQRAVELMLGHPEMHFRLAGALASLRQFEPAVAAYQRVLHLQPTHAGALNNMGIALRMLGRVDDAVAAFSAAARANPSDPNPWTNLGVLLDLKGERGEALACHRRAVAAAPQDASVHSNLLYALHFHPQIAPQTLLEEHRAWDRIHAAPLRASIAPHANPRDPARRLRIGYISPDFRDHPVGRFMLPLVAAHDPAAVEVFCYADIPGPDAITAEFQRRAHHWRAITGQSDADVAARVRHDQIDILVDLTMHMAGNRLLVFARQPAPLQVTYLAYCSTTGLSTMQYRLSDPYLDPPDADLSCYAEQTIRLPQYWCYAACDVAPAVNALPAATREGGGGAITFGCLNGFSKVSDEALAVWAKVLQAVPRSRLLLHANPGTHRDRVWRTLERLGVERTRCEFVGLSGLAGYFATYHHIDIALDPFPYAGGTTTCDALWMGVPVVTLRGHRAVGRGGVSILSTLGLPDWIADTPEAYVQIAATLARDPQSLAVWRRELRPRMLASPLMNAPQFALHMEDAYRLMWQNWCT